MKRFIYVAGCVMTMAVSSALAADTPAGTVAPARKAAPAVRTVAPVTKAAPAAKAAPAVPMPPVANLSVEQIVENNLEARGGLAAWQAVSSMTLSGQMDAGGKQDTKLPFVMTMKRPHKSRLEIKIQDQTAIQVYDGAQGWKYRPFLGRDEVEAYTATELKSAATSQELDGPLVDYAKKGTKIEAAGAEMVEGKPAYKLKLTMNDGEQRNLWIDATSFLEVKIEGDPRKFDGRIHKVAVYYRDYKSVNGLKVPYLTETVVDGIKQTRKMTIQTVTVNPPTLDSLFAKPQVTVSKAASR